MSRAFTCNENFDRQHLTLPQHMHLQPDRASISSDHTHAPVPPHSLSTPCGNSDVLSSRKRAVDDTTAAALTPCVTTVSETKTFYSALEATSVAMEEAKDQTSDPRPATAKQDGMESRQDSDVTPVKQSPASKPKKTRSRASSTSRRAPRSSSSSTTGRSTRTPHRSSLQHTRTTSMSQKKRDDLLALHRDCLRFFQENGLRGDADLPYAEPVRSSTAPAPGTQTSPTVFPARYQRSPPFSAHDLDGNVSDDELLARRTSMCQSEPERPYVPVPATVIDWTSPSTRRREYEKIDRSNRGIRRIWRRLAPKCLQSGGRTPFFEEKDGKGNYEGSVRRFRMDIPDEKEEQGQEQEQASEVTFASRRTDTKWSCFG